MTAEKYKKIIGWISQKSGRKKFFCFLFKVIPLVMAIFYVLTACFLFYSKSNKLMRFVLVPAADFVFVSCFRKILNHPRPYDELDYIPLLPYTSGKGLSFPSRHTSSAIIISAAFWYLSPLLGIITAVPAIFVAVSRIVGGMHYPKDVFAAVIVSLIFSLLFIF